MLKLLQSASWKTWKLSASALVQEPEPKYIIDFFGLTEAAALAAYPALYQRVLNLVKPEREQKKRDAYRDKWWIFAEARSNMRPALRGLPRYIATCRTAKHRLFTFLPGGTIPDAKIVAIALDDSYYLGVLSSFVHDVWALATGAFLEDRPNYNHSDCFGKFPFPAIAPDSELAVRIRALGEQLDAHRKARQAQHPELTLTGMYNVLTKLRGGDPLTAKEKVIHEQGLVSVLQKLHDDLDRAVLDAYGWSDLAGAYEDCRHGSLVDPDTGGVTLLDATPEGFAAAIAEHEALLNQKLLTRLAALNKERAAEEAAGHIRYLRPAFQAPGHTAPKAHAETELPLPDSPAAAAPREKSTKLPWPADLPGQATAVRQQLASFPRGTTAAQLAARFIKAPKPALTQILETLTALGQARQEAETFHPS